MPDAGLLMPKSCACERMLEMRDSSLARVMAMARV